MAASQLVERFRKLFRGLHRAHGEYTPLPDGKKRARTVRTPIPDPAWERHLRGESPGLGVIPITDDATCYWGAIDVDDYTVNHIDLAQAIKRHGIPLLLCRSRSGGAHLFCFFIEPVRALDLIGKLKQWQIALKVDNPDGRAIEIFPKQTRLASEDTGNWLNLPYFGDERQCITAKGKVLSLQEFIEAAEDSAITRAQLATKIPTYEPDDPRFFGTDGPPCLERMLRSGEGFGKGTRNSALFNVGVYLRIRFPDTWEERLSEFNEKVIDPPLDADEVRTITRSLRRKSYVYRCNDQPIQSFCQKRKCMGRRWGIGHFQEKEREDDLPNLGRLTKFETDPPYYTLEVEGTEVRLPTVQDLRAFSRLANFVCEQTNRQLPILRQPHWHRLLDDLLDELIIVTPPPDAGATGQLLTLLSEFLWTRRTSETREDLILGKPYQELDKIYFRSRDFLEYLERKRFRLITAPADIWSVLRTKGSGSVSFIIKEQTVDCWWLPTESVKEVPEEKLEVPSGDGAMF